MKKRYAKPEIIFESFSMSGSIAGDCEFIVGNPAEGTCGIPMNDGSTIFTAEVCTYTPAFLKNDDTWDYLCYHVPIETYNMFNS